jgi:hypothetical protein
LEKAKTRCFLQRVARNCVDAATHTRV